MSFANLAFVLSALCGAVVTQTSSAHAAIDAAKVQSATELFKQRSYTPTGANNALMAGQIFEQQIAQATSPIEKAQLTVAAAKGFYFFANNMTEEDTQLQAKVDNHDHAVGLIDQTLKAFGVDDATAMDQAAYQKLTLSEGDKEWLGHLLYERGANFAQYLKGRAAQGLVGKLAALKRWNELITTCQGIQWLGVTQLDFHGYERVLGYAQYSYGARNGGPELDQGLQLLDRGFKATLDPQTKTSSYGFNVTFLAEALKGKGGTNNVTRAKRILNDYLAVDPHSMNPDFLIENTKAQADAQALLKSWE